MKKKSVLLVLALVLVVSTVVGTTLAWLTASSGDVTNIFTIGDITIELKEHKLQTDGSLGTDEVTENSYKIVPGATQSKDPFVRVKAKSEKCYVYVKVTNNLRIDGAIVAAPAVESSWTLVETRDNTSLYRYNTVVDATSADVKTDALFKTVTYDGGKITATNISSLENKTIVLTAYAHQSENTDQTTADTAAKAWAFPTAINPET